MKKNIIVTAILSSVSTVLLTLWIMDYFSIKSLQQGPVAGRFEAGLQSPPKELSFDYRPPTWKKKLSWAAREYWRIKAHADLARLGIPASRFDPTSTDVPLYQKLLGGAIRTGFDPFTPLARGEVIDIDGQWDSSKGDNPTKKIPGKLFFQLTMKLEDQKRLFEKYPQRNYLPIAEDSEMILKYRDKLDILSVHMHDYNPDNSHIWPGIPHSYVYAPPGTAYDPETPPIIRGDGFPYIQRGHLTLARREIPFNNDSEYKELLEKIEKLEGTGVVRVRYDMGGGEIETVTFEEVWLKINPYNKEPTRILKKVKLVK